MAGAKAQALFKSNLPAIEAIPDTTPKNPAQELCPANSKPQKAREQMLHRPLEWPQSPPVAQFRTARATTPKNPVTQPRQHSKTRFGSNCSCGCDTIETLVKQAATKA